MYNTGVFKADTCSNTGVYKGVYSAVVYKISVCNAGACKPGVNNINVYSTRVGKGKMYSAGVCIQVYATQVCAKYG